MEPQADNDLLVGITLDGRYRLEAKLAEGGMGAVYRAKHTLMNKACAVKVLRGAAATEELAGKRFQREAQSASRLDHENCIRVTDFGRSPEGIAYLVMELLEGRSLAEELADHGGLPMPRLIPIARQVASALAHAHGLGVVHRDLKPDNVQLIPRGAAGELVKVLDFGLAKLVDGPRKPPAGSMSTLTQVGSVFGTPEYMSPEQAEGKSLDARSDLYSFGVVLYQMLTGQLPFQAATPVEILGLHLTAAPRSPADRRPDLNLPASLVSLVMRCLEKDPASRPQSAQAIVDEIDSLAPAALEAVRRVPVKVSQQATIELSTVKPRRRRWWIPALAPVIVVAGWAVWRGVSDPRPTPADLRKEPGSGSGTGSGSGPEPDPHPAPSEKGGGGPDPSPSPFPSPSPVLSGSGSPPTPPAKRPTAADHLEEASRYLQSGNRIKQLFHLQQALKLEPGNREALFRLGAALLEDGQHDLGCAKLARAGNIAQSLRESSGCPPLTEPAADR